MKYVHISFLLVATLVSPSFESQIRRQGAGIDPDACRTPDDGVGACKTIFECQPMSDFLLSKPSFTKNEVDALLAYWCGIRNNEPTVCCPQEPISLEWAKENETSMFSTKSTGNCISITACPSIFEFIKRNNKFNDQTKDALRKYSCGIDNKGIIKVSCTEEVPPELYQAEDIVDDSTHPNYKLLPKKCGISGTSDKITYGEISLLFEFPWAVALKYDREKIPYACGGSLISDRYVLTAAHCIRSGNPKLIGLRLGEHNFNTNPDCEGEDEDQECAIPPQDFEIDVNDAIVHPNYSRRTVHNDIALIRLRHSANIIRPSVSPICLPITAPLKAKISSNYTVIGWGLTEKNVPSPVLLKVKIPRVEIPECAPKYESIGLSLTNSQICAGVINNQDSCVGDSGGPLSAEYNINGKLRVVEYGIVSYGEKGCGTNGSPGVYTRVDKFTTWILDNLKP